MEPTPDGGISDVTKGWFPYGYFHQSLLSGCMPCYCSQTKSLEETPWKLFIGNGKRAACIYFLLEGKKRKDEQPSETSARFPMKREETFCPRLCQLAAFAAPGRNVRMNSMAHK